MIGKEIYKIWAPTTSKWKWWVRPVAFCALDTGVKSSEVFNPRLESVTYLFENDEDNRTTAVIIDAPSYEGIVKGISLAKYGFIPIAVYNGTEEQLGAMSTVNNGALELALIWGADILKDIKFKEDAPPAFLLDSNRMNSFKLTPGVYDNSWDVYSQDMPTAKYLLDNNISKVLIVSDRIRTDVTKIIYEYQSKGIKIYFTDGYSSPELVNIKKPKVKDID